MFRSRSMIKGFIYALILIIPIYTILLSLYLFNIINAFLFIGILLGLQVVAIIAVIIDFVKRKQNLKATVVKWVLLFLIILSVYEFKLIDYEKLSYITTGYAEPEELVEGTNLYLLKVNVHRFNFVSSQSEVENSLKQNQIQHYHTNKISNHDRYQYKTRNLLEVFGLQQNEYEQMKANVRHHVTSKEKVMSDFFTRDNQFGNSAGLGLVLTNMIANEELDNKIPISVTGAIDKHGNVSAVDGIKEKVKIATESNFTYMIIPKENLNTAKKVKEESGQNLEIVAVSHMDEAIDSIERINRE